MMLTAYNLDVQRYIQGIRHNTEQKYMILNSIEQSVIKSGKSFNKLFPNKQYLVLEKITYLLSGCGIWKIGADKLAEDIGVSVTTVYNAVKAIKETGKIIVGRLADHNAGKYIFVLKSHPNFKEILNKVFFIDELPEEKLNEEIKENEEKIEDNNASEELTVGHFVGLEDEQSFGRVSTEEEKPSSNNNNFLSSKQEKNSIKDSIENELLNAAKEQKEDQHISLYYTNKFQFELYQTIKKHTYHEKLKDHASVLGLRIGSNADKKSLILAIQAIWKIEKHLRKGGIIKSSIPAMFSDLYSDLLKYQRTHNKSKSEGTPSSNVPFVNWLDKDLSQIPIEQPIQEPVPAIIAPDYVSSSEELDALGIY
ncbi:helix-turn-helix domain-containing protein [Peribacillus frigoritolerans]|uniref:helix-turn-helix domain-containing protein n=1 Tax=Peribacillus frigoritolerans TaxID=450367 RepID=UPI0021A6D6F9|nr:helix-turn-helix domain-containing protein [Peribacillus frigoritolerans]MCT1389841.1 helix-turn-helix domain-containing protein [Peribacillus frigoritolerans]